MQTKIAWMLAPIAFAGHLAAGVVIEMANKDLRSNRELPATTIWAQGDFLRIDPGQDEGRTSLYFLGDRLLLADHQRKEVTEIDQATLERLSDQMNSAMKQYEEALKRVPESQRAMMEKMLKERMPQTPASLEVRVEPRGSRVVGGRSCDLYEMHVGEAHSRDLCTIPASEIEGIGEAMQAFVAMADFTQELMKSLQNGFFGQAFSNPFQVMNQIQGFPYATTEYDKGAPSLETVFSSAERQPLAEDAFLPPPTYRRRALDQSIKK